MRDIDVSLAPGSLQEAYAQMEALVLAWRLERRDLDDWYRRAGVGRFGPGDVFATSARLQDHEIHVEIRPAGDRWSIKLTAYWYR